MNEIKKIDVHAHLTIFPQYRVNISEMICAEELLKIYDELNIEMGIILPIISPEGSSRNLTSESAKFAVDNNPQRFDWFCNVDPRAISNTDTAPLDRILSHYKGLGAKGVGEISAELYADDPRYDNLFHHCEELDMPVIFHIAPSLNGHFGMVDELHLPRLEKMIKKHPKLKFIGHSQRFWSEISADVTEEIRGGYPTGKVIDGKIAELLRNYDNVYCETSAGSGANALMRDPEYTAKFFEEFSDRIMYGCDITSATTREPHTFDAFLDKCLDEGIISMNNYKKLVRNNAIDILKLNREKV